MYLFDYSPTLNLEYCHDNSKSFKIRGLFRIRVLFQNRGWYVVYVLHVSLSPCRLHLTKKKTRTPKNCGSSLRMTGFRKTESNAKIDFEFIKVL